MKSLTRLCFVLVSSASVFGEASFAQSPTNGVTSAEVVQSRLSTAALEIVRMFEAGVEEGVLAAYVQNSTNTFNLTADGIIYLRDIGIPEAITTAMLKKDEALRASVPPVYKTQPAAQAPSPPPAQPPGAVAQNTAPPTEPALPDPSTAAYVSDAPEKVKYFYDALAPYGTWLQVAGFGWAWQPSVAAGNPEWRPYVDAGQWLWTDRGWYWSSDYSWGWAPFHYGRWQQFDQLGWVWFPDTVWAPSWVTFRYDDQYVGWAPLPQTTVYYETTYVQPVQYYTFVSFDFIFHRHLRPHCVPPRRVHEIFPRCRPAHNFVADRHNTVNNFGVPITKVSAVTGKAFTPVRVEEGHTGGGRPVPGRNTRDGKPVSVVHTPLPTNPKPGPMVAQQIKPGEQVVGPASRNPRLPPVRDGVGIDSQFTGKRDRGPILPGGPPGRTPQPGSVEGASTGAGDPIPRAGQAPRVDRAPQISPAPRVDSGTGNNQSPRNPQTPFVVAPTVPVDTRGHDRVPPQVAERKPWENGPKAEERAPQVSAPHDDPTPWVKGPNRDRAIEIDRTPSVDRTPWVKKPQADPAPRTLPAPAAQPSSVVVAPSQRQHVVAPEPRANPVQIAPTPRATPPAHANHGGFSVAPQVSAVPRVHAQPQVSQPVAPAPRATPPVHVGAVPRAQPAAPAVRGPDRAAQGEGHGRKKGHD